MTVDPLRLGPVTPGPALGLRRRRVDVRHTLFRLAVAGATATTLAILAVLIVEMLAEGRSVLTTRLWPFLTVGLRSDPAVAGVWQGIKGTLMLGAIVAVVSFPLGVGAALYLEEYAGEDSRFARLVSINIRNLAGVPSIVYGLLGLALFVQFLGGGGRGGLTGGRTVISGGLTLALLVLPIVIITAQEALRAVPPSLRDGAYALGATRWEVVRHQVLPAAAPGILTGTILALARAVGEAAPLLVVGAVTGVFFVGAQGLFDQITTGRFTALPMVIFSWARLPSGQGWNGLVGAASVVILAVVFLMNAVAIWLRNRFERRW